MINLDILVQVPKYKSESSDIDYVPSQNKATLTAMRGVMEVCMQYLMAIGLAVIALNARMDGQTDRQTDVAQVIRDRLVFHIMKNSSSVDTFASMNVGYLSPHKST